MLFCCSKVSVPAKAELQTSGCAVSSTHLDWSISHNELCPLNNRQIGEAELICCLYEPHPVLAHLQQNLFHIHRRRIFPFVHLKIKKWNTLYALKRFKTLTHSVVEPSDYPPRYRNNHLIKTAISSHWFGPYKGREVNTHRASNIFCFPLFGFVCLENTIKISKGHFNLTSVYKLLSHSHRIKPSEPQFYLKGRTISPADRQSWL